MAGRSTDTSKEESARFGCEGNTGASSRTLVGVTDAAARNRNAALIGSTENVGYGAPGSVSHAIRSPSLSCLAMSLYALKYFSYQGPARWRSLSPVLRVYPPP